MKEKSLEEVYKYLIEYSPQSDLYQDYLNRLLDFRPYEIQGFFSRAIKDGHGSMIKEVLSQKKVLLSDINVIDELSNKIVPHDILEFFVENLVEQCKIAIEDGRSYASKVPIKDKALFLMGHYGVGKSTLLKALEGAELIGVELQGGSLTIDAPSTNIPHIIIDHSNKLKDFMTPVVHSPVGKDFSYVDNLGFDIKNLCNELKYSYLIEGLIHKAKEVKFIHAIKYSNFVGTTSRGQDLRDAIKEIRILLERASPEVIFPICMVATQFDVIYKLPTDFRADIAKEEQYLKSLQATIADKKLPTNDFATIISSQHRYIAKLRNELDRMEQFCTNIKPKIKERLKSEGYDYPFEFFSKPTYKKEIIPGEREKILQMIEEVSYLPSDKIISRHPISWESNLAITTIINRINEFITKQIRASCNELFETCAKKIQKTSDYKSLEEFIKSVVNNLRDISHIKVLSEFCQKLDDILPNSWVISKFMDHIEFFNSIKPCMDSSLSSFREELSLAKQKLFNVFNISSKVHNNIIELSGIIVSATSVLNMVSAAKSSNKEISEIRIYALNRIFLDTDLVSTLLKGLNLVMIAPNLTVEKQSLIDLSGKDGEKHKIPQAHSAPDLNRRKEDGSGMDGEAGGNGLPGFAGESSGHFYGIFSRCEGIHNLTINLSGGKGGKGQDGGNGSQGGEARRSEMDALKDAKEQLEEREILERKNLGMTEVTKKSYCVKGLAGGVGGDGGAGGAGGQGGDIGSAKIILSGVDCIGTCAIIREVNRGEDGAPGKPGTGGFASPDYEVKTRSAESFATNKSIFILLGIATLFVISGGSLALLTIVVGAATLKKFSDYEIITEITGIIGNHAKSGITPEEKNSKDAQLPIAKTKPALLKAIASFEELSEKFLNSEQNFTHSDLQDFVKTLAGATVYQCFED